MSIKARVKLGADLLDKEIPEWESRQDLEELYLKSAYMCVLGQAEEARDYWTTLQDLFPGKSDIELNELAFEHGFNIKAHDEPIISEEDERYYASLTDEWKKLIVKRRNNQRV